jgi:hypothetical protein
MRILKTIVAAAAAISLAGTAAAQTGWARYRAIYYSDVQMTEEVGYVIVTCDDQSYGNGYLTPYYTEEWWDC